MTEIDYKLRTAISTDRSHLANLIHFGTYLHQHLDWKPALDWIGSRPYLILEKNGEIQATLACPPELANVAWIRLYATGSSVNLKDAWQMLWQATVEELAYKGRMHVAAISLQNWFNELLSDSHFDHIDDVVVLFWEKSNLPPNPVSIKIKIRPMFHEDLDIVESIDHDAFTTIWKNSHDSLDLAFQQSSIVSVAEFNDEIVGYQFSTNSSMGGHLARLAVKSSMQGKGIGYAMVYDLLNQFSKLGIGRVTVNTQKNNTASLALYSRAGFKITGEAYRVFQTIIDREG